MLLQINSRYRITGDERNFILERHVVLKRKGHLIDEWKQERFYRDPLDALLEVHRRNIRASNANGLEQLEKVIKQSEQAIVDALRTRMEQMSLFPD